MKAVRGYFHHTAEVREAIEDLHAAGYAEIELQEIPERPFSESVAAPTGPTIGYAALIGAGLALAVGLPIGMLGMALPNVNTAWSTMIVMVLTWSIASAVFGAIVGAVYGAVIQRGMARNITVPQATPVSRETFLRVLVPNINDAARARQILQQHHGERIDTLGAGRTVV
jgi:hypothetical protein